MVSVLSPKTRDLTALSMVFMAVYKHITIHILKYITIMAYINTANVGVSWAYACILQYSYSYSYSTILL